MSLSALPRDRRTSLNTYNLIRVHNGQTAAVEPLIADSADKAIAHSAGMLTERIKGHEDMFMSPGLRWAIDTGQLDLANVAMLTGPVLGTFDLIQLGDARKLVWSPA